MAYFDELDPKRKQKIENLLWGMKEGKAAAELGKTQRHCPYASGHPLRKGWRKGCRRRSKEIKAERAKNLLQSNVYLVEPGLRTTRFFTPEPARIPDTFAPTLPRQAKPQVSPEDREDMRFTKELSRIYKAPR